LKYSSTLWTIFSGVWDSMNDLFRYEMH
jgi:hypothetical protein